MKLIDSILRSKLFKTSLRFKVAFVFVLPMIFILTVLSYWHSIREQRELEEQIRTTTVQLGDMALSGMKQAMLRNDREVISRIFNNIGSNPSIGQMWLVNPDFRIVESTIPSEIGLALRSDQAGCIECHSHPPADRPRVTELQVGEQTLRVVSPIRNDPECQACHSTEQAHLGVLIIDAPLSKIAEHIDEDRIYNIGISVLSILLVAAFAYQLIQWLIVKRVGVLYEYLNAFAAGDFSVRVPKHWRTEDEITRLADHFNNIADALERHEKEQREIAIVRQEADAALRASEEKYRRLVELSPDAISIESNDRVAFINPAGVRLFGAEDAAQLLGRSVWDFVPPGNVEAVKERNRRVRENNVNSLPVEQRFVRLDGAYMDVEVLSTSFLYHGEPATLTIFRDITEQRKAREELVKLKKAVETSGEVIFLTDRQGVFTYVNPEFIRLYGYSEGEVVGKSTPRIIKSGMLTAHDYEVFWNTILGKQVAKGTWVNKNKAGTLIHIEGSVNPVLDDNGDIAGFLAIQHDVTQRTQEEEKIQQRNKELNALYTIAATLSQTSGLDQILDQAVSAMLSLDWIGGGASGMLFLLDEQKRVLSLAAHRGVPAGHPCLLKPPKIGECLCGLAIQRNDVMISEEGRRDARHSRRWEGMDIHRDICLPIRARGRVLGVMDLRLPAVQVVAESDINLLKSMTDQIGMAIENARLTESNRKAIFAERERIARDLHDDMGQLLGYVNTKVAAVRLLMEGGQYAAAGKNLGHLEEAAQRLSLDVRKAILDLKASGSAQMGGDLVSTLKNYIDQFNLLGVCNATFEIGPQAGEFIVPPETGMQVLRIVQEAITNAMKHAGATEIALILSRRDDLVEISVSDNGSGFDPASVEQSAYPHFGMSTMRERVEGLGGVFDVDTKPGAGTRVIVSIPIERREFT